MEYFIDYTRIANSGRLNDRFITAQVKRPLEGSKIEKGDIFALVEITKPWFPNSQIGQKIINALYREYQRSSNTSDLVNFELSLKKVNKTLAQIAQNGDTDWIGNINAIFAVISADGLHLAQSGKGEAYLIRGKKILHITEGAKNELDTHPLNTFGDIMSGSLKIGDKLLFTSPLLLDYVSTEKIRQIVIENTPYNAAQNICSTLKREKNQNINAIIIEVMSKEAAANRALEDKKEVIYLDQGGIENIKFDFGEIFRKTKSAAAKTGAWIGTSYHKAKKFTHEKISPHAKNLWAKTTKATKDGYHHLKSKTAPALTNLQHKIKGDFTKNTGIESPKDDEQLLKNNYNVHHYHQPKNPAPDIGAGLSKFFNSLGKLFAAALEWIKNPKNRLVLYIVLVTVIAGILILSVGKLREKQTATQTAESQRQTLQELNDKFNSDYKLAILYNDQNKAKGILENILTELDKIKDTAAISRDANDLYAKVQIELDKLTNTTRLSEGEILSQFDKANQFSKVSSGDFGIADNGKIINFSKLEMGAKASQISLPADAGTTLAIAPLGDDKTALAYTSNKNIFTVSEDGTNAEKISPLSGDWASGNALTVFTNNIYILDGKAGQIYKHTKTSSGYEKATQYLDPEKTDIKGAVSLAIDGAVYVLLADGSVKKLSKAALVDFSLNGVPTPYDKITDAKKIFADSEASSIYLLAANRVLEFDKTGKYLKQYLITDLNNITDFTVDYKAKKLFLLDSNKIYAFPI